MAKIEAETPLWKRPAWWWTRQFGAWPVTAEWLSAMFDYNVAPFFQSFIEVRVELSANRILLRPYGIRGRLTWGDLASSESIRPAGATARNARRVDRADGETVGRFRLQPTPRSFVARRDAGRVAAHRSWLYSAVRRICWPFYLDKPCKGAVSGEPSESVSTDIADVGICRAAGRTNGRGTPADWHGRDGTHLSGVRGMRRTLPKSDDAAHVRARGRPSAAHRARGDPADGRCRVRRRQRARHRPRRRHPLAGGAPDPHRCGGRDQYGGPGRRRVRHRDGAG